MRARLVLAGVGIVAVIVGAHGLRADHRCTSALSAAVRLDPRDRAGAAAAQTQLADRCAHPSDKTRGVFALGARGHVDQAETLARQMTCAAPDDYEGWAVLARFLQARRPAAARAALARAHALNPRGAPAPPRGPAR